MLHKSYFLTKKTTLWICSTDKNGDDWILCISFFQLSLISFTQWKARILKIHPRGGETTSSFLCQGHVSGLKGKCFNWNTVLLVMVLWIYWVVWEFSFFGIPWNFHFLLCTFFSRNLSSFYLNYGSLPGRYSASVSLSCNEIQQIHQSQNLWHTLNLVLHCHQCRLRQVLPQSSARVWCTSAAMASAQIGLHIPWDLWEE